MSRYYKNQNKKKSALKGISFNIGIDVDIVEKKMKYLLAQYRRERRKTKDSKVISFTVIDFLQLVSCLDTLNLVIFANNSKSDSLILVKSRNPLPSYMLRFATKPGRARVLSNVFIRHLCLRFFLLASLLITLRCR
jgi:hypothetical protein